MIEVECPKCGAIEKIDSDSFWIEEQSGFLRRNICSICLGCYDIWVKKGAIKVKE